MPKGSVAYANMRRALIAEVAEIPEGHVVEAPVLGAALNIPARYVGAILARLTPEEQALIPWHRVIPKGGAFARPDRRSLREEEQLQLLMLEGHQPDQTLDRERLWTPNTAHSATFWADFEQG